MVKTGRTKRIKTVIQHPSPATGQQQLSTLQLQNKKRAMATTNIIKNNSTIPNAASSTAPAKKSTRTSTQSGGAAEHHQNKEKQTKKKQKLVKHKRSNWSKTDIEAEERAMDEVRVEKLSGGVRADKTDEELFFINKTKPATASEAEAEENQSSERGSRGKGGKGGKLTLAEKMENLACYRNLRPDPISAPKHHVSPRLATTPGSTRQAKRAASGHAHAQRVMHKKTKSGNDNDNDNNSENRPVERERTQAVDASGRRVDKQFDESLLAEFDADLWDARANAKHAAPTITPLRTEHYLRGKRLIPAKRPMNRLVRGTGHSAWASAVPRVQVPHPGASYMPDYDDHQALLLRAHEIEQAKLRLEQKELRALTATAKKMSWHDIEQLWLKEMTTDNLFDADGNDQIEEEEEETQKQKQKQKQDDEDEDEDEDEEENEEGEKDYLVVSKRQAKKKLKQNAETRVQRKRKQLLAKLKQRALDNAKKLKREQNEIYRLKSIKKEVAESVASGEAKKLDKELADKHDQLFGTKRLGRLRFEEPELDLKLTNELTGTLRELKPEGNILRDRYKSMQKRNIIEPRERARHFRKYALKKYDKKNAYEKTHYID